MAAMMRFALLGLALCAASIGLSEQGKGNNLLGCFWPGKELTPKAKEIKEIGDALKSFYEARYVGKNSCQLGLDSIRKLAKKNTQNMLANSIKDLKLEACDKSSMEAATVALDTIEKNKCHVENQAERLNEFLGSYLSSAELACRREEELNKENERERLEKGKRDHSRRQLIELSELLDGLGPDSSLTSQLELIASRGFENTLAAKFKGITMGHYSLRGLKAADQAIEAIEQMAQHAPTEAERLRSILLGYKKQMLKNRMQDLIKDWPENDGALLEQLDEEKLTAVVDLSEIIVNHMVLTVRDDLRLLIAAKGLTKDLPVAIKDDITLEIGQDVEKRPSWTYHKSDVLAECEHHFYEPCEAFMALGRAEALKDFYEASDLADIETIMDAIGKEGNKGSNLAEWAGRWGVCNLILSQGKDSMADAIVQTAENVFGPLRKS